jgi:hypothetical protein
MALQLTPVIPKPVTTRYTLTFDYTLMNDVMSVIKACQGAIVVNEAQLFCKLIVDIPLSRLDEFIFRLDNLYRVEYSKDA